MTADSRYPDLNRHRPRRRDVPAGAQALSVASILAVGGLLSHVAAQDIEVDEKPYEYPNDTFITIDGTVVSATPGGFVLDYGGGDIVVEMDRGDGDVAVYAPTEGDEVSVYGLIDDGLFERRTIEAGGIYVERLDAHFDTRSTDEHDDPERGILELPDLAEPGQVTVNGTVTDVDRNEEQFVLDTGSRSIQVTLDPTPGTSITDEDPGTETVQVGSRVIVRGRIDDGFFEGREMIADVVQLVGE